MDCCSLQIVVECFIGSSSYLAKCCHDLMAHSVGIKVLPFSNIR
jgi:hypothetical protein